jgi:diketogulonate reductase-like aldo/keto reductase
MLEYNAKRGILVQSWSTLSRVLPLYGDLLDAIGKKYGKSSAQAGLRWIVKNGAAFSTESKKSFRYLEYLSG